jgi:hypothetical protein
MAGMLRTLFFVCLLTAVGQLYAQADTSFRNQLVKVLSAYPERFASLKGSRMGFDTADYYSKICFKGVKYCLVDKDYETGKTEFEATIQASEEMPAESFKKLLESWKARIAAADFNGVPFVPYKNDKYSKDPNDMYWMGEAWRLKTDGYSIDSRYLGMTIRLELLDLDQGGFMLRLLVTDN